MLCITLFSIYMLTTDDKTKEGKRRKTATKAAILGLLIALWHIWK